MRTIEGVYTSYRCLRCGKESILITEEVTSTLKAGKHISCSHCGYRNLKKEKVTDNFKECLNHSAYKKIHGAIRQVRYD